MFGGFGSIVTFNKKIQENRSLLRKRNRFDRSDNLLGIRDEFLNAKERLSRLSAIDYPIYLRKVKACIFAP